MWSVCVCVCVCHCTCGSVYIFMGVNVRVFFSWGKCVVLCVGWKCACVCPFVCFVCVQVNMCETMCNVHVTRPIPASGLRPLPHTHTHTHTYTRARTYTHTHTHACRLQHYKISQNNYIFILAKMQAHRHKQTHPHFIHTQT